MSSARETPEERKQRRVGGALARIDRIERLEWTIDNIYTVARRETARQIADERADKMWRHVMRLCEKVGASERQVGVLRGEASAPAAFSRDREATCDWNCARDFPHDGPCSPERAR